MNTQEKIMVRIVVDQLLAHREPCIDGRAAIRRIDHHRHVQLLVNARQRTFIGILEVVQGRRRGSALGNAFSCVCNRITS
jgi:hypothetical protein